MFLLKCPIESPQEYLAYLRQLLSSLLSSDSDRDLLNKAFTRARKNTYGDTLQPAAAMAGLSSYLIQGQVQKIRPRQYPNGAALVEAAGHWDAGAIPDPAALAQLGVFWGALGVLEKNKELCTAAVKVASWQSHLLDHQGILMQGIWAKSTCTSELVAYHSLLFSMAYALSGEEKFQRCAAALRPQLKSIVIPELAKQISKLLQDRAVAPEKMQISPFLEESLLGMAKASGRNWTAIGALSGYNTGMGAFHKDEAACVAFGPLKPPFDDLSSFGIERLCSLNERTFGDIIWEKSHEGFLLKGWTKAFTSSLWFEAAVEVQNGQMKISIEKEEGKEWDGLSFAFFVKADEVSVGECRMKALSLSHFEGKAQKISFKGLEMASVEELPVKIVPLAGGDFFWGADFLLVCPLQDNNEWIIY